MSSSYRSTVACISPAVSDRVTWNTFFFHWLIFLQLDDFLSAGILEFPPIVKSIRSPFFLKSIPSGMRLWWLGKGWQLCPPASGYIIWGLTLGFLPVTFIRSFTGSTNSVEIVGSASHSLRSVSSIFLNVSTCSLSDPLLDTGSHIGSFLDHWFSVSAPHSGTYW